jgi:hypothetical protein
MWYKVSTVGLSVVPSSGSATVRVTDWTNRTYYIENVTSRTTINHDGSDYIVQPASGNMSFTSLGFGLDYRNFETESAGSMQWWARLTPGREYNILRDDVLYSLVMADGTGLLTPGVIDSGIYTWEVSLADSDGDGMPDIWENNYFGNLTHGAGEDYDNDGMSNLSEYHSGTNPADSGSVFRIVNIVEDQGAGTATIIWNGVSQKRYDILRSAGPFGDAMVYEAMAADIAGVDGTMEWVDSELSNPPVKERYYKVLAK